MQHLVDTNQLTLAELNQVMMDAKRFKYKKAPLLLGGKIIVTLFFENSTRTRSSFEVAAKRLGASMVFLDPAKSSTQKGESLTDTFSNLCAMEPDAVIIRHSENGIPQMLADKNILPVINAGAGNYAHPTQSLLDYFTMLEHFDGKLEGKTIAIIGDIASSRVASSGIRLFTRMGMNVVLVAPKQFMPQATTLPTYENIADVIDEVDIIMSLRAQLERHEMAYFEDYSEYASKYCINDEVVGDRDILILHPGPVMRNVDISDKILDDDRCKVLEQVRNGVYVRMAVLKLLLLDT